MGGRAGLWGWGGDWGTRRPPAPGLGREAGALRLVSWSVGGAARAPGRGRGFGMGSAFAVAEGR